MLVGFRHSSNSDSTMKQSANVKRWNSLLTLCLVTVFFLAETRGDGYIIEAPPFAKTCKLHDDSNGPCLADILQTVFVQGIENLSSIDPIKVKKLHLDQSNPPVDLKLDLTKTVITGLAGSKISNSSVQFGSAFKFAMTVPKMSYKGQYNLKGTILVLDIDGKGPFTIDISDLVLKVTFKTETIEQKGQKFFDPLTLKAHVEKFGDIKVRFDDLYDDSKELTDSANDLFNVNRDLLVEMMTPIVEETMDAVLYRRMTKVFASVPARHAFTDIA